MTKAEQLLNYQQDSTNFELIYFWPKLEMFVQASQAQVSRESNYLHSVGQGFTCLLKPHRHK